MSEARYLRATISSFGVADWNFDHFQVQFGSAEDEVKVTKWIKVSKIGAVFRNVEVVRFSQDLGAAKRIGEPLVKEPREDHGEEKNAPMLEGTLRVPRAREGESGDCSIVLL